MTRCTVTMPATGLTAPEIGHIHACTLDVEEHADRDHLCDCGVIFRPADPTSTVLNLDAPELRAALEHTLTGTGTDAAYMAGKILETLKAHAS